MNNNLGGLQLSGDTSGTLGTGSRLHSVQVATTSALAGTITLSGAGGVTFTTAGGLNGVQSAPDLYGPAYFQLSDPADVGKARVSWIWG